MPIPTLFSMPGPQFNDKESGAGWFKRHARKIFPVLVIALLALGAFYFYRSYQTRITLLKPTLEEISASPNQNAEIKSEPIAASRQIKGVSSAVPEVKKDSGKIVVAAAKGNGATHLARYALKEYLKDKPELAQKLGPEQRIFIEDYLQKKLASPGKTLHVGDQITFSDNDLEAAIEKALALNDNQIKNLGQYVPLVPSLMTI